ncbi:MAG: nitroreductase [Desulfovibrionaceae bacterium]|nr:nitroreductase [Desulfovibrionaceae bacterium]
MNDILRAIRDRRSIRKYQDKPVSRKVLERIVEAGLWAPSAMNRQPWHLTVVQGRDLIDRINVELKAAVERMPENRYKAMVGNESYHVSFRAPALIIVSAAPNASPMNEADCSCALQNIFLAAYSLGVGSCWVNQLGSVCAEPGFRILLDSLGVPSGNYIHGVASLGYAADDANPKVLLRRDGNVNWVE